MEEFLGKRAGFLALCFVAVATVRICATYTVFSFTIDEPGHFACGLQYLSKHIYRYLTEQPPLARAAVAFVPYITGVKPLGEPNYNLEGRDVILRSADPTRTLALMRVGVLPFFWLASAAVYFLSRRHFAPSVPPLAVALFTLLPPVLAHAGIACTDMALTGSLGVSFLAFDVWSHSPTWKNTILLGVTMAGAVLCKFTALLYLPAAIALTALFWYVMRRPSVSSLRHLIASRLPLLLFALFVGSIAIWAAYWFSFGPVPDWKIKLPAPEFFDGLLVAQAHNRRGHPSYLLGQFSLKGWWYYFPVTLAVKTPLALLVLAIVGISVSWTKRAIIPGGFPLALCLGVLLPAMAGNLNIGIRHILPIYIGLSILAAIALRELIGQSLASWRGATAIALSLWMAGAGIICHPDYLSYFNEVAAGEPADILVDSNLDWGQDTKRLGKELRQVGAQKVSLMLIEPLTLPLPTEDAVRRLYGIPPVRLFSASQPDEGWNVVSPTIAKTLGISFQPWWDRIKPTEKVGTLWLYHVQGGHNSGDGRR